MSSINSVSFTEHLTPTTTTFTRLCMFCFKCVTTEAKDDSSNKYTNGSVYCFVKLLERFMEKVETIEKSSACHIDGLIGCCKDCELLINSFCQEYHHLKCLELQLEWKLGKLVNIMKLANRVPSRVQQLRRFFADCHQDKCNDEKQKQSENFIEKENERKLKSFRGFRQRLVRKCSQRLSNLQPRVSLRRVTQERVTSPAALSSSTVGKSNDKCNQDFAVGEIVSPLENVIGWLMSFAAVALLASATSVSIPKPIQSESTIGSDDDLSFEQDVKDALMITSDEKIVEFDESATETAQMIKEQMDVDDECEEYDELLVQSDDNQFMETEDFNDEASAVDVVMGYGNSESDIGAQAIEHEGLIPHNEAACSERLITDNEIEVDVQQVNEACTEHASPETPMQSNLQQETYPKLEVADFNSSTKRDHSPTSNIFYKEVDNLKMQRNFTLMEHKTVTGESMGKKEQNSNIDNHKDVYGTSGSVKSVTRQYNLRNRQNISYSKIELDSTSEEEDGVSSNEDYAGAESSGDDNICKDKDNAFEEETCSLSSLSDSSNDDSDSEEQNTNGVCNNCNLDGCNIKFKGNKRALAEEHKQLHAVGEYKCNFCDVVLDNVIKLIAHETEMHSPASKSAPVKKKVYVCTRCSFKTCRIYSHHWHFARTHLGGFKGKQLSDEYTDQTEDVECKICQIRILKKNLDTHFKKYHDKTNFEPVKLINCNVANCLAYFKTNGQLERHKEIVHGTVMEFNLEKEKDCLEVVTDKASEKTVLKCKLCKREYSVFGNYRAHKRLFHNADVPKLTKSSIIYKFVCNVDNCKQGFKTLENLETHQKLHGSFTCNFCNVVKENANELALHEIEHEQRGNEEVIGDRGKIYNYKCSRCKAAYVSKRNFTEHFVQSHLDISLTTSTCSICKAESLSKRPRGRNHIRHPDGNHFQAYHKIDGLDPSEIFRCNKCPAYFIKSNQLTHHLMDIHFKYTCPECGKSFLERGKRKTESMKIHIARVHSKTDHFPHLTFHCTRMGCKSRFGTPTDLDMHTVEVHDKTPSILEVNCPKCNKKFRRTRLKQHLNNFHAPRSHMCSECGKTFKGKETLLNHLEYHKDPETWKFQCATCGKRFAFKDKLASHTNIHTKGTKFICQFCGVQYSHRHNWRNHIKKNHAKEYHEMEDGNTFKTVDSTHFMSRKGFKKGECILARKAN